MSRQLYLVCYDISDDSTLQHCWQKLSECVDATADDLCCYTIPQHSPMLSLGANVLSEGLFWSGLVEPD